MPFFLSERTMDQAKILIVEDEPLTVKFMTLLLSRSGYCVCGAARTGEEAIAMVRGERPDLVLMDIKLPGEIDGIAAAECIREREDIPILFVSAYATTDVIARTMHTRPSGYVTKPFKSAHLLHQVEMALSGCRAPLRGTGKVAGCVG